MHTMNRRRAFLVGTAALAAAPVAIAVTPAVAAPAIQENPELLEIGRQIPALLETYRAALARKAEAAAIYERTRPPLPDELVWSTDYRWDRELSEPETDLERNAVYFATGRSQRQTYRWKLVQSYIIRQELPRHTKEGKRLRKIARVAKKYERETAAALKASGYWLRDAELNDPISQMDKLAWKLHMRPELKPRTSKGVLIFASATLAIAECSSRDTPRGQGHAGKLGLIVAHALSRIEGGHAA